MNRAEARIKSQQNNITQLGGYNNKSISYFNFSNCLSNEMQLAKSFGRKSKKKNNKRKK